MNLPLAFPPLLHILSFAEVVSKHKSSYATILIKDLHLSLYKTVFSVWHRSLYFTPSYTSSLIFCYFSLCLVAAYLTASSSTLCWLFQVSLPLHMYCLLYSASCLTYSLFSPPYTKWTCFTIKSNSDVSFYQIILTLLQQN